MSFQQSFSWFLATFSTASLLSLLTTDATVATDNPFYNTTLTQTLSGANSTFLYTYGSEIGFIQYGIAYQVLCLLFEFFMIVLAATPLISKKGRTWQKKVLFALCMAAAVMDFSSQPFDLLRVFHPVQDKSISNVGGRLLIVF